MKLTFKANSTLIFKRIIVTLTVVFFLMNVVAFFHAYKFTHFVDNKSEKTSSPDKLSPFDKFKTLLLGVSNPRPENDMKPDRSYRTVTLESNKKIECWQIELESEKSALTDSIVGTVIIFHGYGGHKSSMLDKSEEFLKFGYNTLLVDFMGSGGSEGNQTTLGYHEAEEVKTAYDYLIQRGEKNVFLFGTSMGAVAIMKAINDYNLKPSGIIIECPFGSMYQTVSARFKNMKIPSFPMAALLVFWGGVQNEFWAYNHNPAKYAQNINCPTLLLYGEQDKNVSRQEIDEIYANLKGTKTLKTYKLAGHENYLLKYKYEWKNDIKAFLSTRNKGL